MRVTKLTLLVLLSYLPAQYSLLKAQSFPVTITASGATTFCDPGSVTLSAPLSQTGTTAQLAPNSGTAADCNCPAGYVVVGIQGRTGFWLDQFSLICQQLTPAGTLTGATVTTTANGTSVGGLAAGPYLLPAGNVMVGASTDYYTYASGQNYLESVGLKGQTPAFIIGNGNNTSSPSTATTIAGNQTPTASLGTQYAPNGSVITGMKSFDKTYSAGVQWIYTPISQIMTSYLWSPGGQTTRSITVSTSNTYTLSVTAGYGTGTASQVVTVNDVPATPSAFLTSDDEVCRPQSGISYSIAAVTGATSYTWNYTGNGETITNGSTTAATVAFSSSATSGNMRVRASNTCGNSSYLSMAVTIQTGTPANAPGNITGNSSACQGQTGVAYSTTAATGTPSTTSYTWTYTTGTGVTITGNTINVTADFSTSATTGTVNVRSTNACGNNTTAKTRSVTVNPLPAQPSTVTGNTAPCNTSTAVAYSVTPVTGVTFAWSYSGTGASFTGTNPISVDYTNATSGTWTITPTNSCGTGTNLRTFNTTVQPLGNWLGTSSSVWTTTGNWGCGTVPTLTTDVIIPSGVPNMPLIVAGGTSNTKNLTINSGATLTLNGSGALNIAGNFTNGGTFTDNNLYSHNAGGGKVSFVGSTATMTGANTFGNLTVSNSTSLTIPAGNATTVNGILTLSGGVFATNGNLSQNLYNGAIAPGGSGTVTGSIRFFKTIWGDKYHYISLPVPTTGITTTEWTDDVVIKSGANSNLYTYNEAIPDSSQKVGWTAVAPGAAVTPMVGYALYFPRWIYNTTVDVSASYDNTMTSVSSPVLKNTPSTTPVPKPASDGWNFLGNPFPSTIDWTLVAAADRAGLNNAIYAYDSRRMLYTAYVVGGSPVSVNGGTQYIGSMQGFFVKVTTAGVNGTLILRNAARVTTTLKDVWRTQGSSDKRLRLTVANGSYADEMVVRFHDAATEQFDGEYDGYKMINDAVVPSLFAYTAEANYSVNTLPNSLMEKTIPLQLNVASDTLCTWTADMSGFTQDESMVLEDRLLGTAQDLSENPTFAIQLKKGVYANRFYLQYSNRQEQVTETKGSTANGGIDIAAVQQNIVVLFTNQNPGDANIAVFDALGKRVYDAQNVSTASGRVEINFQDINNGIYIVKVQTPSAIRSQQVYLIK
jgi:hypothetical protein